MCADTKHIKGVHVHGVIGMLVPVLQNDVERIVHGLIEVPVGLRASIAVSLEVFYSCCGFPIV
jgi:hypothetical protein